MRETPTVFGWLQWKEYSSVEQYERKGCRWWHKQRKRRKIEAFERDHNHNHHSQSAICVSVSKKQRNRGTTERPSVTKVSTGVTIQLSVTKR